MVAPTDTILAVPTLEVTMRFERRSIVTMSILVLIAAPVLAAGDLLVASFGNDRVMRYDAETGAFKGVFVPTGSGGLTDPEGLALGPQDGDLYVSSYDTNSVLHYDGQSGAFLGAFVTPGSGGLDGPLHLVFTGNKLLLASANTDQVLAYDLVTGAPTGAFVTAGSGGLDGPWPIDIGPDGQLYVGSRHN